MLTIHFANRYESLAALLTTALGQHAGGLFTPDELIVPSAAVRRQLTLGLARQHGVCANLRFSYLAQWLWLQAGRVLDAVAPVQAGASVAPAGSPWQPGPLAWRVYTALADSAWLAGQPRLAAYLAQADAVTRLDLAQRVAGLLDQYGTYRPDWLQAWAAGERALPESSPAPDEAWQAALWRRLVAELPAELAPAAAASALQHLSLSPAAVAAAGLPAVAHVFCLPTIAPVHLALLQQLGRWIDLRVYALNPCQEYWFEVVDRRRLSHLAARGQAAHQEVGHRLLAGWGQQAQAQLAGLVDACGDAVVDDNHYTPYGTSGTPGAAGTLLTHLQNSVLAMTDLAPRSVPLRADDRSIEVHVCHSLTRQLEVLQDTLLTLMAQPDAPAPGEILVVTPDLEAAAPLIDSVFGTAPRDRALPYTVTGQAVSQVNAPARALLAALALAGSRCTASTVFGLLQQPVVARRFGLDEDDLAQVQRWLLAGGVHWALDAGHRAALGLPAVARHSLADGLDRLFLGYALPSQAQVPFDSRLPAGAAEGTGALPLGALWRFAELLHQLQTRTAESLSPSAWPPLLDGLIDALLLPAPHELDDAAELRAAVRALASGWQTAELDVPLPLAVVQQALTQALDEPARGGVPTGRITFSSMSSLRSLPYRVVCLIGLDDGAFPSAQRPAEFDLMAQAPRRGDRQRRTDERNLFLDLLLAARDRVHLSYTGRSVRDNAPLPPSVLVSELLETLQPALDAEAPAAHAHLVVAHPLQAFDRALFEASADPRLRSHHREYALALSAAQAGATPGAGTGTAVGTATAPPSATATASDTADTADTNTAAAGAELDDGDGDGDGGSSPADDDDNNNAPEPTPAFFPRPLAPPPAEWRQVSLDRLQRFFRHPSRFLLQQRLGLVLRRPDEALEDDEPFLADRRSRAALARQLLPALAAGADAATLHALAEAGTALPAGLPGQQFVTAELPWLRQFAQALAVRTQAPLLPPHAADFEFNIAGQPWLLQVSLADLRPAGLLRHRYDEARAGDYIDAWIAHVALCACAPAGVAGHTQWLGRDGPFSYRPCEDPITVLHTLLALYAQGINEPLYFFPRSAWAWLKPGGSLSKAQGVWRASARQPYAEQADAANQLALRGLPDPMGAAGQRRFEAIAHQVIDPLLDCLNDPRAP